MFHNYLRTALRNIRRNPLFTGLNIFGLATGLACSILIFSWVQDEVGYDSFNAGAERIFRLTATVKDIESSAVPYGFANAIRTGIPSIKNATRIHIDQKIISVGARKFDEKRVFQADTNFLRIFNYPLLRGEATAVLRSPNSIVLTEATAIKYFGSADQAMGKSVFVDNDSVTMQVTGILRNIPSNSHLQFDMLLSIDNWDQTMDPQQSWRFFDSHVYFQLADAVQPSPAVLKMITRQMEAMRASAIAGTLAVPASISVQPLEKIHLYSHYRNDYPGQGNISHVRILSLVALFILVIACINFMNLATALSGVRAKEVGLRKTIGALRRQLVLQFIGESMLLSFIALGLALLLVFAALPFFNELAGKSIPFNLASPGLAAGVLAITVITGLLAGSYPAFYISSFSPIKVLKGEGVLRGAFLRNGLVVLQFAVSIVLMVSTVVVYQQLRFVHNRDIGFDRNNLLYVSIPRVGSRMQNSAALRSMLRQSTRIGDFTITGELPTDMNSIRPMTWRGANDRIMINCSYTNVDEQFIQTFGMKMVAGRFYSNEFADSDSDYVVNETTVRTMGLSPDAAIGKTIAVRGVEGRILGVVKDFNFKAVYQPIEPLVMRRWPSGDFIVFRCTPGNLPDKLSEIRKALRAVFGDTPIRYGFVDQDIDHLYTADARMGRIFNIFSILSVVVSCLGLFGLATFSTQRRTKEIGIRKVLGSGEASIVLLLAKEFLQLVILSLAVAFPIAWFVMDKWLREFVYRTTISPWIFAATAAAAVLVAFVTVGYQTIRAAVANPVNSLRSE
ncbi:ABC transporter permease [Puia sp. P3]|uniref:ABC transporter permease n=1 Tax=Puia sp. P3 TaxID=3423952 RepID=UPI003D664D9C